MVQKYYDWIIVKKRYCLLVKLLGITNRVVFAKMCVRQFSNRSKVAARDKRFDVDDDEARWSRKKSWATSMTLGQHFGHLGDSTPVSDYESTIVGSQRPPRKSP